ncbi:MAG: LemA family protein [Clostridiaceae bacterium]|jgi:LemA protein|nr:LemA family protein [Clostridiaceae bacterium]
MFGMLTLPALIVGGAILLFVMWWYSVYVALIQKKNKVKEAFADIDVQLKKRYDLIPNILTIANKFMEHETELMSSITSLRTQAASLRSDFDTIGKKIDLDSQLQAKMGQLMVNVENYPTLKSDQTMLQAMQTYNEVEEHIAAARRFYNAAINDLNNAVEIWPSSQIAQGLGIRSELPMFEAKVEEREAVSAGQFFTSK